MKKTIYLILAAMLAVAFGITPALATLSSVGTISDPGHPAGRSPKLPYAGAATPVIVSAPASVLPEAYTSNTEIRVFDEQQNVTLPAPLSVDQTTDSLTSSSVISAGTVVNSHYLHLDNIGISPGVRGLGYVTFDGPIIGVITQDSALYASHSVLGASGTTYPASGLYRGLEQGSGGVGDYPARNWTQQDIIWISGNTITIDLQVFNVLDSFRVITEPESEPFITNLCAGQDIEIGNTIVENDGTTLSVTYEITEPGWLLVETHLEVVENEEDFPTTQKGNPQVGHFTWSETHDPPVESFTYTIPLTGIGDGVVAGDPVYIAAHAAVVKITGDGITEVWATNYTSPNQHQGWNTYGNHVNVALDRSNEMAVTGQPDAYSSPYGIGFYSLGEGGDITIDFGYPIFNGAGEYDISIHEISGNRGDPTENAEVYVIVDGDEYYAGSVSSSDQGNGIGTVSIPEEFLYVNAVKIKDTTDKSQHIPRYSGDGYDVDAVDAYYLVEQEETAWGGACDEDNYWSNPDNPEGFVYFFNPDGKGNWASYFEYTIH